MKKYSFVELNGDQNITLLAITTMLSRKEQLVWGILSKHAFQTTYVDSNLIESPVVEDAKADVLRILVPWG